MKKVLYISNIEVPYRTEFFNKISENVNLTVLYERENSSNRDKSWTSSVKSNFSKEYLNGIKMFREYTLNFKILKYAFSKKYDDIVIGCYNSPSQMLLILMMKIFRKKYILNLDGEYFIDEKGIKGFIKRFFIRGANKYIVAGESSANSLSKYIDKKKLFIYYFSSLSDEELKINSKKINSSKSDYVLVVGQYFDYKGLDIALNVASQNNNLNFLFVGSGKRCELLEEKINEMNLSNVEVIPFLAKEDLYKKYQDCKCLLLPSRKECWGLVVNEAASFGCPIVSTLGSGAAVEFLSPNYSKYLAKLCDSNDLSEKLNLLLNDNDIDKYKSYLIRKSKKYSIENNVDKFLDAISR